MNIIQFFALLYFLVYVLLSIICIKSVYDMKEVDRNNFVKCIFGTIIMIAIISGSLVILLAS